MRKTTGISLMLLIFLTLTLVTFSLLSLSGASADSKLSQETADRTTLYYQTETAAYNFVGKIDSLLAEALKEAENEADPKSFWLSACSRIPDKLSEENTDTGISAVVWDADAASFSFDSALSDEQVLHAELSVAWPENDSDTLYTITVWQVVNTQEWTPDQTQDLY